MPETQDDFYKDLKAFDNFTSVTDLSYYSPLPDDWDVVLTDITSSTRAIEQGRYKDVNLVGAACITAVTRALPEQKFPHIFGGDGATMAVPSSARDAVKSVLGATRRLARKQFGLDLRAGIVPLRDIRAAGADVLVAKLKLSPGNYIAMMTGGGIELVDAMLKSREGLERYQIPLPDHEQAPDLEGLSCRWEPLKSCHGAMISMLVYATGGSRDENFVIYREVIDGIARILQQDPKVSSPVSAGNMSLKWPPAGLGNELRLFADTPKRRRKRLQIYLTSLVQLLLEKFNLSAGGYNAPVYRAALRANSDYRRFDDMLRMILDCSGENAKAIEAHFMDLHTQGKIVYGLHQSERAYMTCLVFSLEKGEHVHFVDGADGGFTKAALQLKQQRREAVSNLKS